MSDKLVWIDLEMTGLDPEKDSILEIATLVTDPDLNILAEGPNMAIFQEEALLASMDEWNQIHHGKSGLLERVRQSTITLSQAESITQKFLAGFCHEKTSPLCGNSVWQDRRFLQKHMPSLESFFHYRIIDVSSIKELVRRWYPDHPPFEKKGAHLALNDIRESVGELKYYRESFFLKSSS